MYVCIHTYIYTTCVYVCVYTYVCTYIHSICMHIIIVLFQGINLDNINVTLVPVPGQLYVYKASIASIDPDDVSMLSLSTVTIGISSFIIRVSTVENNLTTYSLLVGCDLIFYVRMYNSFYFAYGHLLA